MDASCVLIGPATLRSLYVEQLRTTDEIATQLGCSGTTVLRHLRRFKIPVVAEVRVYSGSGFATALGFLGGRPNLPMWSVSSRPTAT